MWYSRFYGTGLKFGLNWMSKQSERNPLTYGYLAGKTTVVCQ